MKLVCIGAHPDDAEVFAGGLMVRCARAGHRVCAASLTNGDAGHHEMGGGALARRRRGEALLAARRGGYEARVFDHHDGELEATLALRKEVVRLIREYEADVVITHRPNDYHPDHRYASVAVQDAAFMVTVPHFCPDIPALRKNPIFLYFYDPFQQPVPFRADIAVDVDGVMAEKWGLLDAMASQFYEWLPWLDGVLEEAPSETADPSQRRAWLETYYAPLLAEPAQAHAQSLRTLLGADGDGVRFVELFQLCEYGRRLDDAALKHLFPF